MPYVREVCHLVRGNLGLAKGVSTHVDICESNSWIFDHDLDRLDDGIPKHFRGFQLLLLYFALRFDVCCSGQFPQTLGSAPQNIVGRADCWINNTYLCMEEDWKQAWSWN
jgi:hypothetical protein